MSEMKSLVSYRFVAAPSCAGKSTLATRCCSRFSDGDALGVVQDIYWSGGSLTRDASRPCSPEITLMAAACAYFTCTNQQLLFLPRLEVIPRLLTVHGFRASDCLVWIPEVGELMARATRRVGLAEPRDRTGTRGRPPDIDSVVSSCNLHLEMADVFGVDVCFQNELTQPGVSVDDTVIHVNDADDRF